MSNNIEYKNNPNNGKTVAGIILLALGAVLLLRQTDLFFFPGWLFSWYTWFLILPGLWIGARSNFQKPVWFILVMLGFVFMAQSALHTAAGIIWPIAFIVFGIWMILRRNNKQDQQVWQKFNGDSKKKQAFGHEADPVVDYTIKLDKDQPAAEPADANATQPNVPYPPFRDDTLNATAIFGGVDKIILSKQFRGGEIINIFGGTEIDFTKADIDGHVVIDITQVFGGTKLIVPPHWHVMSDMASIFAGVDDKRMRHTTTINSEKVLVLRGVSIFAGIDIRSY